MHRYYDPTDCFRDPQVVGRCPTRRILLIGSSAAQHYFEGLKPTPTDRANGSASQDSWRGLPA